MKQKFLLLIFSIYFNLSFSQISDTISNSRNKIDINNKHWSVNINTGLQHRFFAGVGISKNHFLGSRHGVYGYDIYTSVNFFPAFKSAQNVITAFNIGALLCGNGGVFGIEMKYVKEKAIDDIMIVPKIGLGFGMLHLTYGYALSVNKYPIEDIRKNTFTLHFNLPFYSKDLLKKPAVGK